MATCPSPGADSRSPCDQGDGPVRCLVEGEGESRPCGLTYDTGQHLDSGGRVMVDRWPGQPKANCFWWASLTRTEENVFPRSTVQAGYEEICSFAQGMEPHLTAQLPLESPPG